MMKTNEKLVKAGTQLAAWANGFYLAALINGSEAVAAMKLVVQR